MFVRFVAESAAAELVEPDDCTKFHVEAASSVSADVLAAGLASCGAAAAAPDGGFLVAVAWVRAQAAGRTAGDWDERFARMLGYAQSKGWLSQDGEAVTAHVVTTG